VQLYSNPEMTVTKMNPKDNCMEIMLSVKLPIKELIKMVNRNAENTE